MRALKQSERKCTFKSRVSFDQTKVTEYPGGAVIQSTMEAVLNYSHQLVVPQVVRVSESSYAMCGIPDTYAENGFVHVKSVESRLQCSVTNCYILAGGNQLKAQRVCIHVHLPSCCLGLQKSTPIEKQLEPASTSAISAGVDQEVEAASSVSRLATIRLNMSRKFPYNVPLDLINIARNADYRTFCGMDGGWPSQFIPEEVICLLCGSALGEPRCHPSSRGKALLLTNINAFLSVDVRVKMCSNKDCQAMHQPDVHKCGKFNKLKSAL